MKSAELVTLLPREPPPIRAALGTERARSRASSRLLGRFLELAAAEVGDGRILDIGCGEGWRTLVLARSAPGARIVAGDPSEAAIERARRRLSAAGWAERTALAGETWRESVARLAASRAEDPTGAPLRLAVLSPPAAELRRAFDAVLPLLALGGKVVLPGPLADVVRRRSVAPEGVEREGREIERFLPYFTIHPQVRAQVLPFAGGVGYAVKIRITVREQGGPF